jgi:serine/threonine protein kinase
MWKGTEVAVKMMTASEAVTKNARESFVVEARTMAHLRHPNVVLFMGASTKPPHMCIVMEFMALGSLFDVRFHLQFKALPLRSPTHLRINHSCCTTT